jgi:hypothetical protein
MNRNRYLTLWNLCIGGMDTLTGVLLMVAPAFTLRLMGLPALGEDSLVFLSWIGAFVVSTGLAYGLVFGEQKAERGPLVWTFTSLVRSVIAGFVTVQVMSGRLDAGWLTVALTDAAVAAVQVYGISRQWWKN